MLDELGVTLETIERRQKKRANGKLTNKPIKKFR